MFNLIKGILVAAVIVTIVMMVGAWANAQTAEYRSRAEGLYAVLQGN